MMWDHPSHSPHGQPLTGAVSLGISEGQRVRQSDRGGGWMVEVDISAAKGIQSLLLTWSIMNTLLLLFCMFSISPSFTVPHPHCQVCALPLLICLSSFTALKAQPSPPVHFCFVFVFLNNLNCPEWGITVKSEVFYLAQNGRLHVLI